MTYLVKRKDNFTFTLPRNPLSTYLEMKLTGRSDFYTVRLFYALPANNISRSEIFIISFHTVTCVHFLCFLLVANFELLLLTVRGSDVLQTYICHSGGVLKL